MKIRPQECLAWSKVTKGPAVSNLQAFYNSHIRLAAWVKYSILSKEALGRRSDTVDKWIRVAEVCFLQI
jgi:son of sevenless